ncbi:MAG: fructose bisphosphate aldolase [Albidovulum sp.]|nr:fructose bisphosphate aldolase [Albidovulum sp.]MDE0531544.1 fructose bisphosphate aldolase [Albidovulum sp.]
MKVVNSERTCRLREDKGFIAALDQSGGSTPKALKSYGIEEHEYDSEHRMFELMHEMRVRIMGAPAFSRQNIIAAILFEKTIDNHIHGMPVPDYLWEKKRVLPFLKVDVGLMDEDDGVQMMKPIPDLDRVLGSAVEKGIYGTKMRSVINAPSASGIKAVVEQQFETAERIIDSGLVPIVEPEVSIGCPNKAACEVILHSELLHCLDKLLDSQNIVLKLTIPDTPNMYSDLISHDRVVRVSALSGGYSRSEACSRLEANGGMIASFSRALTEGLHRKMNDGTFNDALGSSIARIYRASCT